MSDKKIPVALVLGSGGARGLAHIGVIRALHDSGRYDIKAVSGCSIGALIGGLYAAGKLDVYEKWATGLSATDVWGLLDFSFTKTGIFKGDRLMEKLGELVGDQDIERLDITFSAVASDIEHRREVWLDTGPLFDAIRASIAIPGFFTPVSRNGCTLVDGGLLSPLPIAPIVRVGSSHLIVVTLNGEKNNELSLPDGKKTTDREQGSQSWLQGFKERFGLESRTEDSDSGIDILSNSLEAMQDRIARYQMAAYRPDKLIEIPVNACEALEFHRAEEMIKLGYKITRDAIDSE
ncbi:patatin-like phospholipase family protein [Pseudohongiella sp.]|uniref:PNPLA domain-containing protein n=1 Tax=marine sediment metagenome TaxID=412755 RepID=A0A0F9YI54_9ZZZZ|nr:patatin-like phospholipase family protein [Pseudohongiella sp.]HDZ08524.1 serine protease [Pseudohongiella sp.]HEA61738.1 serine protease [Pseudohongiella sp.]